MIVLGIGVFAFLVTGVVLVLIINKEKENSAPGFNTLDLPPVHDQKEPESESAKYIENDYDRTRILFDEHGQGSVLKCYCLEIVDADHLEDKVRVNVQDRIVIGRGSACTVRVPHMTLSKEHCEITLNNGVLYIRDLGSQNGTLVNGAAVDEKGRQLDSGSMVQLGGVKLWITLQELML